MYKTNPNSRLSFNFIKFANSLTLDAWRSATAVKLKPKKKYLQILIRLEALIRNNYMQLHRKLIVEICVLLLSYQNDRWIILWTNVNGFVGKFLRISLTFPSKCCTFLRIKLFRGFGRFVGIVRWW